VTYTINGTVSAPAPSLLSNTASLVIPGSITDYNPNNNSATSNIPVNSNFSTSTKTVVDLNNTLANASPGDTLQYTITLNETAGANATGVIVTDNIPANVTNFTVVSTPAGSTDNSTITGGTNGTGYLNITNITVPANGSVTIVFTVTISSSAVNGTTINNTATITPSAGTGAAPAAATVTVNAASGSKPLYLYDNTSAPTYKLSRTKPAGLAGSITLNGNNGANPLTAGTFQAWNLNPALASSDTISGNVPVTLYLARTNNAATTRVVEVRLACSSTPGTYLTTAAGGASITLTTTAASTPFTLTNAGTMTCANPNYWILTVVNNSSSANRQLIVYPMSGTNNSYVNLPSQNVINIDSVTAYNGAYPGGAALASFTTGTIYLRAVVSDPFGSYDIDANNNTVTQPTIVIKNPGGTPVTTAWMPRAAADANNPTALTRTFEYQFLPAAPVASGNWTATVTALEGTENAISDTRIGTFKITPSLSVLKSAQTYSDPYNGTTNPKAIPGAMMLYTVQVTNTSYGSVDANSTVITDAIPANTSMCVSTLCSNPPLAFTCSASPACGLTFNYLTNVTYTCAAPPAPCPQTDANGYGTNVTSIAINPAGTFNGAPSSQSTNFSVTFKVKIK
jgi:fimbrial isopeptide formation D2 family protein/uncharacterized repeat protein (TIGR01451 family)